MRELPILFNTEMVRKILSGYKTKTRRVVKPLPPLNARLELVGDKRHAMDISIEIPSQDDHRIYTPPYLPGDILYVREAWQHIENGRYIYRADKTDRGSAAYYNEYARLSGGWRPSIHMPKEAARIFLRVTDVGVERLQEIDADGMLDEGLTTGAAVCGDMEIAKQEFALLWNSTVKPSDLGRYGWAANPWVWVIEFERCEKPKAKP